MTNNDQTHAQAEMPAALENVYVRVVMLDPAPDEPEALKAWCEKHGGSYLGEESGRRAWFGGDFMTYLRGGAGIAELSTGDRFIYYDEDIVRIEAALAQAPEHGGDDV